MISSSNGCSNSSTYYSRVVGYSRISNCLSYSFEDISHSFFIKPKLQIIFDSENKTQELNELEDARWGTLVDTGTPPEGILIPLDPVFYPKRRS